MFDFDLEALPEDLGAAAGRAAAEEEPALEQRWEGIGSAVAMVYRPPGDARVPLAVVLVPGNPGVDVVGPGTYHAFSPGLLAIGEALEQAGVPFVRYDYEGIGLSAPGGPTDDQGRWAAPAAAATERNTREVLGWARHCLSDHVVACCWNYGACDAAHVGVEGGLHGLISVSLGYNVYMSYYVMGRREEGERLKGWYDDFNRRMACKTMYVVGSMDKSMTPLGHIRRFIKERSDGGKNATLHIIEQKGMQLSNDDYFRLKGSEQEVARACTTWIQGLQQELEEGAGPTLLGA